MLTLRALSLDGNAESKDSEPINLLKYVIQPHLIQDTKKVSLQQHQSHLQPQLPVQVSTAQPNSIQPHTQQKPQVHQQSLQQQQQTTPSNHIVKVQISQQQSINASTNNINSSQGISTNIIEEKVYLNIYFVL